MGQCVESWALTQASKRIKGADGEEKTVDEIEITYPDGSTKMGHIPLGSEKDIQDIIVVECERTNHYLSEPTIGYASVIQWRR